MAYRVEDGWRKVSHEGGSYVVGVLYNILTGDEVSLCLRDYDYADGSRDNDDWYYADIDAGALRDWRHKHGAILAGDMVKVVKGRKIEKGFTGVVESVYPVYDRYGRSVATYVRLGDGRSTNISNCVRI